MERNYKISIPEPCSEDWNKMTPNENGRFCMSCSKTVVDFTLMSPEEIQQYFTQNKNEGVCGRFKNSQLETITIQIPSRILHTQTQYHKIFLLALFIAMGTTLFSCSDKDGNKNRIHKVEIVNTEKNQDENETVPACYGHQFEPKKAKYVGELSKGFTTGVLVMTEKPLKYDVVFSSNDLDIVPSPKDGMKKFYSYFAKNYKASKQLKMSILFVVEKDGTLSNFNVTKNTSSANEAEVIKVLESGPKWIPGKVNNQFVLSTFILPITLK
jgi:hypothetical protein